ncbi:MAG: hypothetical protein K2X39_03925, partial [Silvanigrellaceae bacterium]|nr:hypothetical protein [Silvanigrellaceae bacterium]
MKFFLFCKSFIVFIVLISSKNALPIPPYPSLTPPNLDLPLMLLRPADLDTSPEEVSETNGSGSSSSSTQRTPLATSSTAEESSRKRNYAQYEADGGEQTDHGAPQGQSLAKSLVVYLRRINLGQLNPAIIELLVTSLTSIIQNKEGLRSYRTLASLLLSRLFYENRILDSQFLDAHGVDSEKLDLLQRRSSVSDIFKTIIVNYTLDFKQASAFDDTFTRMAAYAINFEYIQFEDIYYGLDFPLPLIDNLRKLTSAIQIHSKDVSSERG